MVFGGEVVGQHEPDNFNARFCGRSVLVCVVRQVVVGGLFQVLVWDDCVQTYDI